MKLVAVKRIGDKRPVGTVFDEPNPRAKMLVKIGLAKPYVEPEKPVEPVVTPEPLGVQYASGLSDVFPIAADRVIVPQPRGRGRSSRG